MSETRDKNGHFLPGVPRPANAGKKKGHKERSSAFVDFLFDFFEERADDIANSWDGLDAKSKFQALASLSKYLAPTLTAVSFEDLKDASTYRQLIDNIRQMKKED